MYDVPKPKKKPNLTEEDLYMSDTFSFGQQIGPLTNISTSIYALLPLFEEGSREYNKLIERLKQCCVNQSKQIDKTKIGQDVKCIPKLWINKQCTNPDKLSPEEIEENEFYNRILANKKPYFFKYKYKQTAADARAHENQYKFGAETEAAMNFDYIKQLNAEAPDSLTDEQNRLTDGYMKYLPVIDTPCVMNNICHYIEDVDFHIKQKVRNSSNFDYRTLLSKEYNPKFKPDKHILNDIQLLLKETFAKWKETLGKNKGNQIYRSVCDQDNTQLKAEKDLQYLELKNKLLDICLNEEELTDHLIYIFYELNKGYSKTILWSLVGKQIYMNLVNRCDSFYFPIKDNNGSVEFMYEKYQINKFDTEQLVPPSKQYSDAEEESEEQTEEIEEETEEDQDDEIDQFDKINENPMIM